MIFIIITIITVIAVYIYQANKRPHKFPPGPSWLPMIGNQADVKKLAINLGSSHAAYKEMARQHSTDVLGLKLGKGLVAVTSSFEATKTVLTNDEYVGRPDNFFLRLRCMGTRKGVTCVDGAAWSIQRSFVVRHLRNLGFGKEPMEMKIKDELLEIIDIINNTQSDIRIAKILAPSVLNVLWALIAGSRISRSDSRLNKLLELLHVRSKAFDMSGGILSQHPWLRFIAPNRTGYTLIQKLNAEMAKFFLETIQEHHKTWYEGRNDDLIHAFITEMKSANGSPTTFTDEQLIMVCLDLFIGGAQTTSGTLDFAFLLMLLHPQIQAKAQQELDKAFGSSKNVDYSERQKVPYVEAVIMEVERYRYVVPVTGPRRVLNETHLHGHTIPKETTVLMNINSICMDPEYWKDPEVFRPERFISSEGKLEPNERLIPFGLGKRRCLGETLARNCLFTFFAGILCEFTVQPVPGTDLPSDKPIPGITLTPQPYKVQFTKRKRETIS